MKYDKNAKDLEALNTFLDQAISSAQENLTDMPSGVDVLIRVANIVKQYVIGEKNPAVGNSAARQELIRLCQTNPVITSCVRLNGPATGTPAKDLTFQLGNGTLIQAGKLLGSGGEGDVYKLPSMPGKVAKIYRRQTHNTARDQRIERKLRFLNEKKDAGILNGAPFAAFPEELVYDRSGALVGYIMPQFLSSTKLFHVQRDGQRQNLFPDLDYRGLIAIAHNLAEAVHILHSHNIVIGDLNANNILVQADGSIRLLDVASYDVTNPDTGEHFPCCVGLAELLAPEVQMAGRLEQASFTKESDCFSLAIHIFRLLANNADPFGFMRTNSDLIHSADLAQTSRSIIHGECVYFRDIPGKAIPPHSPDLSVFPAKIRELFRRTFDYTPQTLSDSIRQRPTAKEWMDALEDFHRMPLLPCSRNPFHLYLPNLHRCPFCPDPSEHTGHTTVRISL